MAVFDAIILCQVLTFRLPFVGGRALEANTVFASPVTLWITIYKMTKRVKDSCLMLKRVHFHHSRRDAEQRHKKTTRILMSSTSWQGQFVRRCFCLSVRVLRNSYVNVHCYLFTFLVFWYQQQLPSNRGTSTNFRDLSRKHETPCQHHQISVSVGNNNMYIKLYS